LVRIVLQGSAMPHTSTAPSELAMPPFGWRLTDANVADVLSFVRRSWGNQSEGVTAQTVAQVRGALLAATPSQAK
jgi:mono/diheme cytochrome c family protein